MKVTIIGGPEPIAPKAVWDLLAFLHNSFMPVTQLILAGDTPATKAAAEWAQSLAIKTVQRADSKGKPDAVVSVCPDVDATAFVDKAKAAGIRVYEVTNA